MAHTGKFATSDEILVKAGANVAGAGATEARINDLCAQAESLINVVAQFNFSDWYNEANSDLRQLLAEAESNFVAIYLIMYDMSGYTSRVEAEDMINVLRDGLLRALALLKDKRSREYMDDGFQA
jgi:hypothetical protein